MNDNTIDYIDKDEKMCYTLYVKNNSTEVFKFYENERAFQGYRNVTLEKDKVHIRKVTTLSTYDDTSSACTPTIKADIDLANLNFEYEIKELNLKNKILKHTF